MRPIITLTTDFGTQDPFVGIMKGVILSICPDAQVVDITHEIEPQNIRQGALAIQSAWSWFPAGTVHVVVVDPGVGSARRHVAATFKDHVFIGPDNGVLAPSVEGGGQFFELAESKFFLKTVSTSFHGRDVFAPTAGWVAKGTPLSEMGLAITDPVQLHLTQAKIDKTSIIGEVVYIDRFGNLMTNIQEAPLRNLMQLGPLTITIGNLTLHGFNDNYAQGEKGQAGAIISSWGQLEVFVRDGNAADIFDCDVGKAVLIKVNQTNESIE